MSVLQSDHVKYYPSDPAGCIDATEKAERPVLITHKRQSRLHLAVCLRAALVIEGWGVIDVGLATFAGDYNAVVDRMLMPFHKPKDPAMRAAAVKMLQERLKPVKVPADGAKKGA